MITQFYVREGVDYGAAKLAAQKDLRDYQDKKERTERAAASVKADTQARLLLAAQARDRVADAAAVKLVTDAQARASNGDRKALAEWIALVERYASHFSPTQKLAWATQAADQGSVEGAAFGMRLMPENSTRWEKFRHRRFELGDPATFGIGMIFVRDGFVQRPVAETDARSLEILEKGYAATQHLLFAEEIVRILLKPDGDVGRSPARALEWALKAQNTSNDYQDLRHKLLQAVAADRNLWEKNRPALLAAWQRLASEPFGNRWALWSTSPMQARVLLVDIFSGRREKIYPGVERDLDRANRYALEIPKLHDAKFSHSDWAAAYYFETGQFEDAERIYAPLVTEPTSSDRVKWMTGLLWRDRTDGKADLTKAIALMEAGKAASPESARALADSYFQIGDNLKAIETLKWGIAQKQPTAKFRLALAFYAGEGVPFTPYWGDLYLDELEIETKGDPKTADLRREGAFQRVAAPLLRELKRIEAEGYEKLREPSRWRGDGPLKPWVLTQDPNAPVEKMWGKIISGGMAQPRAKAAAMEKAAPKLRELALDGYEPAQKLWGQVVLSGLPETTPEDRELGREFLRHFARQDDSDSALILGESLFSEGLRQIALGAPATATDAILGEAADWLEASQAAGHKSVRFSLATLYRDGLGRPKSLTQARQLFQTLEKEGDGDAKLALVSLATPNAAENR